MGLWDRVKGTLGRAWNAAAGVVGKIRKGIGSAVKAVTKWGTGVVTRNADRLQAAGRDLIQASVAAQRRTSSAAARAQKRLQAATRIHDDTLRKQMEIRRIRAMSASMAVQADAARKALAAQKAIKKAAGKINKAVKAREKRLKQDLAAARAVPRERETIADTFHRAALATLLERKAFAGELHPKAREILDKLTDTFGVRMIPDGPKHMVIIPAAGIHTGVPGTSGVAARRIGQVIQGQGIKTIIKSMEKSPLIFLRNIRKLKPADKAMFLKNIATAPGGKKVAAAIQKDSIASLMKAMPHAQRQAWKGMLKKAPSWFKKGLAIGAAIMGTEFMVGWLRKEATEPLGIASWGAYEEKKWGDLKRLTDAQRKFQAAANNSWVAKILENFPVLGPMFEVNRKEQVMSNEFFAKAAEEGIINEPEATGQLKLDGTPSGANVYIAGSFHGKLAGFNAELPTGSHSILIDLKGYEAQRLDIVLEPGEEIIAGVDLEASDGEVFRKWERAPSAARSAVANRWPKQTARWEKASP
ncbi:hypothetical protein LCGC14_2261060, partial [marine sediment metagenome]